MTAGFFPANWELTSLVCKLLLYFAAASIAGGSVCLWQFSDGRRITVQRNLSYMMLGAFVGFQATLVNFFAQVGQLSGAGLAGMFDWGMASILLETSLGDITFYRLAAFVWAILATFLYLRKLQTTTQPFSQMEYRRLLIVYAVPFLLIAFTLRLSGHVSVLSVSAQIAIVLHFTAFALWIGALYPLLVLTSATDTAALSLGMKRFGDTAIGVVLILFGAGIVMVLLLLGSPGQLLSTPYGIGLSVKLALVTVLLGIAAINKLYLVPRLSEAAGAANLRKSIRIEMGVASLILIATAYFSTIVGPPEH